MRRLQTFSAFKESAFRLLWLNTFSFMLVNGSQRLAVVYLVLEIKDSALLVGVISFALGLPLLLFSLPAGVLIDNLNRRRLLFTTQTLALIGSMVGAILLWTGAISTEGDKIPQSIALVAIVAFIFGSAVAMGQPLRQAIIPTIIGRSNLMNAIALNTITQNVSQIIGPALAGSIALLAFDGFFVAQAAFLALGFVFLIRLRVPQPERKETINFTSYKRDIAEGIRFVVSTPNIRVLIILLIISALLVAGAWGSLLPKIARDNLGAGVFETSMIFVVMGIGTLCSSLFLASIKELKNAGGWFIATNILGSSLMIGLGLSHSYPLTLVLMGITGINAGFFMNLNLTLIQAYTPQHVMGRVMSVYTLCFMGGMPLGALISGLGAEITSAGGWFVIVSCIQLVVAITAIITQPSMRRMSTLPADGDVADV